MRNTHESEEFSHKTDEHERWSIDTNHPHVVNYRRTGQFVLLLSVLVTAISLLAWHLTIDILTLGPLYMFTPMIAAMSICYRHGISLHTAGLRWPRKRWIVIAAIGWPPIALVIVLFSLALPGVTFDPTMIEEFTGVPSEPLWQAIGLGGIVLFTIGIGMTLNALIAFGEEFGWRGYLLWELAPLGFWKASVLIGALWGVWHTPLVLAGLNYPSFPIVGILLFPVICILFSPVFTYIVIKGDSVLPAAVLHGVFNATGFLALASTDNAVMRELVVSEGGLIGIVAFSVLLFSIHRAGTPSLQAFKQDKAQA